MGRDKGSLPVGQATLVEHLARRLGPVVDEILVGSGRRDRQFGELRSVEDEERFAGLGPLAGMQAGFVQAQQPLVWVVACDLPEVQPALGALLRGLATGVDAVVPRLDQGPEGVCAIYWGRVVAPVIEEQLTHGHRSVQQLLDRLAVRYVHRDQLSAVDPDLRSFRNLNTPSEYERWLRTR